MDSLSLCRANTEVVPALVAPNSVVELVSQGRSQGFHGWRVSCLVLEGGCDVDNWSVVIYSVSWAIIVPRCDEGAMKCVVNPKCGSSRMFSKN